MTRHRLSPRALVAALGLLSAAPPGATALAGQTSPETDTVRLIGRVVEAGTGRALEGARVSFAPAGSTEPGAPLDPSPTAPSDLTNGLGAFELDVPTADGWTVIVEGFGYVTTSYDLPATAAGRPVVLPLSSEAIELEGLEVTANSIRERFEARRNAARGIVRFLEADELRNFEADNGFDLFWKFVRMARPCPGRSIDFCVHDDVVRVCIDDRPAFGSVDALADYQPAEFYLLEAYDEGRTLRAYTHAWIGKRLKDRRPRPLDWGC